MSLTEKVAVVTGSTGALGHVVTRRLYEAGVRLGLPVRSLSAGRALVGSFAGSEERVYVQECRLDAEESVRQFVEAVRSRFGRLDALVNLAGGYIGGKTVAETTLAEFDEMINTNLRTMFLMSRTVLSYMVRDGASGRIISIGAMPALTSGANKAVYALSKRGVIALTETIAEETRGTGITANVIVPGILLTESNRASMPHADTSKWTSLESVADVILFLCSEQANGVNGTVIKMFGGL